jgi:hypothetical protein
VLDMVRVRDPSSSLRHRETVDKYAKAAVAGFGGECVG